MIAVSCYKYSMPSTQPCTWLLETSISSNGRKSWGEDELHCRFGMGFESLRMIHCHVLHSLLVPVLLTLNCLELFNEVSLCPYLSKQ